MPNSWDPPGPTGPDPAAPQAGATPPPEPAQREPFRDHELPPPLPVVPPWAWDEEADEDLPSRGRRSLAVRVVASSVAALAVAVAAAWMWNASRDMPPLEAPVTTLPQATTPPPSQADAGVPTVSLPVAADVSTATATVNGAPHQRFSWSLAALGSLEAARELAQRLGRAAPDQAFIVAPVDAGGETLYRVLGGLAVDQEGLRALREPLARSTRLASDTWVVRDAPGAFLLKDFDDVAAATARAQELWNAGVPVYVLSVDRDDGSLGYRLYAGAYADEAEGQVLKAMLEEAGVRDMVFTERRGQVAR